MANITEGPTDKISQELFDNAKVVVRTISRQIDVEEHLDLLHASDDIMENLTSAEEKALGPKNNDITVAVVRQKMLTLLECLVRKYMPGKLFDAVLLLDNYCSHKTGALQDSLPVLCAAVVNLLMKQDNIRFDALAAGLTQQACWNVDCMLEEQGLAPIYHSTITGPELLAQERLILSSIQWRLTVPTSSEWIRLSGTRLHVLTCSQFVAVTTPLWHYASYLVSMLTSENAATSNFAPRRVAHGTIVITCLVSCLISVPDLVILADVDAEKEDLLSSSLHLPQCPKVDTLQNKKAAIFMAALLEATGSTLDELLEDARVVRAAVLASPTLSPVVSPGVKAQ
jgi:hypothetical protein